MIAIIFDTETTGLPVGFNPSIYEFVKWPNIIQLSYIVYDIEKQSIIHVYDTIIKVPNDAVVTEKSIEMHGITKEMSLSRGGDIRVEMEKLNMWLSNVDVYVGHNLSFDKRMVIVECARLKLYSGFNSITEEYCTMKKGTMLCNIHAISKKGKPFIKYPTLSELYYKLFNEIPEGTHNSLMDVKICMRCYLKYQFDIDIDIKLI
jgi:DNA polymerase III epsilon subunit-like protein